jgi:hypothetical protein
MLTLTLELRCRPNKASNILNKQKKDDGGKENTITNTEVDERSLIANQKFLTTFMWPTDTISASSAQSYYYDHSQFGACLIKSQSSLRQYIITLCTVTLLQRAYKTIPVTSCGGPKVCETSKFPHFLDNRLTDGGEVLSLMRRPPFISRNLPGTHFC